MKNAIFILTALLIFPSCKQQNNSNNSKMSDLTSKNYVERMLNNIKHFNYEPMYYLTFRQNSCFSEILVNDIPVNKNFKEQSDEGTLDINNYIFKSGIQKVTFRLYPAGKVGNFDLSKFVSDTEMNIEITESDNDKKEQEGKKTMSYTTPITTTINPYGYSISKFEATGKTYYEASFTFNATVPYQFDSLSKGMDLRKQDPHTLEKKVIAFYKNQWEIINSKKVDDFFSFLELKEKECSQSVYDTRVDLEENLQAYLDPFTIENFKLEPLENYKMVFYGDGRIVCLELTSLDGKLRGKSALWGKFEREGLRAKFRKYYLYIPDNESELKILR
ncbi:hypothetical protein [Flavobacterium sp. N2038]|uniref:hypothetical protein n=1 Tax=Flavobacterium sp. N2038 TaxID=2986829 RepID=UPI002224A956|nr:hypothetical protein [Flavobacterium sp. N2038]